MKNNSEHLLGIILKDSSGNLLSEKELPEPEKRFSQTSKMLATGLLSSSISHEIINPNNYISLSASMLSEIWEDIKPALKKVHAENGDEQCGRFPFSELEVLVPKMIQGIIAGSGKIVATLDKVKAFTAASDHQHTAVNCNSAIHQAAALLRQYSHKYTGNFQVSLQEDVPPLAGNEAELVHLFTSLIMNALQSLPHKRAAVMVESSYDRTNGCIVITVRDEGVGMAADLLSRLTEPFFTTREAEGSAGLGLFIAAAIARNHQGTLEFQSLPGVGTTATVRLPALSEHAKHQGRRVPTCPAPPVNP